MADPPARGPADPVATGRVVALAMLAGEAAIWVAAVSWASAPAEAGTATLLAALAGALAPALGWRLWQRAAERRRREDDEAERAAAFVRAIVLASSVTAAASTAGAVAYVLERHPLAALGLVMHIVLIGALWPGPERLRSFGRP